MTVTTKSGYVVELKDVLSFGDRKAIKRVLSDAMLLEMTEDKKTRMLPLSSSVMADAQTEAVRRAVVSITRADGSKVVGDLLKEVDNWPEDEAELVYETVEELFGNAIKKIEDTDQKKE